MLTPFNFTPRKIEVLEDVPRHDDAYRPDDEDESRCASYECDNLVKEDGDDCDECKAYEAEIRAECLRDYIHRPADRKQLEEAVDAYSEPSERHKRDAMLREIEQ